MILILFIGAALADQIAAYVGSEIILESQVRETVNYLSSDPMIHQRFPDDTELRNYVLEELISQKLIMTQAEPESITISDLEVDKLVEARIKEIRERYPSEADFLEDLKANGITFEELKAFNKENMRSQMVVSRFMEKKIKPRVSVSPIAVRRFYEANKDSITIRPARVRLAHILLFIKPSESAMRKSFENAVEIYKLLYTGADFGTIAGEFSDDENSRHKGGMLGRVKKGETLEEFEQALFSLKPGIISEPFLSRIGYHIVEVMNRGADWVLARQILIRVETTRADTLRYEQLARQIRREVGDGADFDSLARYYSDDPQIDLGEWIVDQLSPPIYTVVKNLEPGELSEATLTPYGYHQIYLREKVLEEPLVFEDLRDQIYEYLFQKDLQKYFSEYVGKLKERTYVKVFDYPDH